MQLRFSLLFLIAIPGFASAQFERFELGRRLIELEKAWDVMGTIEGKKRALEPLSKAVNRFFGFQFSAAGQSLDQARYLLQDQTLPSRQRQWADAITINPETRLLDGNDGELSLTVLNFYCPEGKLPEKMRLHLYYREAGKKTIQIEKLPLAVKVPMKPMKPDSSGDWELSWQVEIGETKTATRSLGISRIESLAVRLETVREKFRAVLRTPKSLEIASLDYLLDLLTQLQEKNTLETNYPANRLLQNAEEIAEGLLREREFFTLERSGQFWGAVPLAKFDAVFRIFVPKGLNADKPVPVVFAMHGAGGSENLFFDGYGDGIARKLCEERGWIMVAPRSPGFLGAPPIAEMLDVLRQRYPIDDKRVFLVGHSMGAAQAISVSQQIPDRLCGVAALGGGGQVRKGKVSETLPYFIGVGSADFALSGARTLHRSLQTEKVMQLELKEYPNLEHMMIVRDAIPEVFERFDKWGKNR
jgi:predicted esterase